MRSVDQPVRPLRGLARRQLADELAQRFQQGPMLIVDLAAEVGRSPSLVRRLLEEAGVRTGGMSCVGMPEAQLVPILAARYRSGVSIDRLHRETGIDWRVIRGRVNTESRSGPRSPCLPSTFPGSSSSTGKGPACGDSPS
ncbi:MAG: helix-turn-helix domain-containing protein [Pseudonocardiaceae bacterium]